MSTDTTREQEKVIQINESAIKNHLGKMVRSTVEETLNQMLESEADRLCNAEKYQRSEARRDTRAGHYQRKLHTTAGEVTLNNLGVSWGSSLPLTVNDKIIMNTDIYLIN